MPAHVKAVYSSGGSTANIIALGAARQWAYEQIGIDPAKDGINQPGRIYATAASHHTIQRAAAMLGFGRDAVITIESDEQGRMKPESLRHQLEEDARNQHLGVAIVANAGTTSTGAIDPLQEIGILAKSTTSGFMLTEHTVYREFSLNGLDIFTRELNSSTPLSLIHTNG
nr:pyridoxal-dependent decarboxylase [Sedimenticola hydrogenitrophicus]